MASKENFKAIKDLKLKKDFVGAWNYGNDILKSEQNNEYLKISLFWVCYSAIKNILAPISKRSMKKPNKNEIKAVNSWVDCVLSLKLPVPCDEFDYRFFNLFKGCGEHYKSYIQMITSYGSKLFKKEDLVPFQTKKGEAPSLAVRVSRQASKAYLSHNDKWHIDIDSVLKLLQYSYNNSLDKNKIWLQYDTSKCLIAAKRYHQARSSAISVLQKKMSESWAWAALGDTYLSENPDAAISCYAKGILEAHEPPFCIPIYFELAKLFVAKQNYKMASSSAFKLLEIYQSKDWNPKPEHDKLLRQPYITDDNIDLIYLDKELNKLAENSFKYAFDKTDTCVGIVDSHHRSGKGFNIYLDLNKKLSSRIGLYQGRGIPEIGTWVEVNFGTNNGETDVLSVKQSKSIINEHIKTIEGILKLNDKGFGFIDNVFIPPHLLNGFKNGDNIKIIKIWDKHPKTGRANWKAIKVNKL